MLHREAQLGYGTRQNPGGLIIGVKVNDGIHFPTFARESQYADFERFFYDGPAFPQTPLYVEFQRAIVPLAGEVARNASTAPEWSSEFESELWIDDVVRRVKMPPAPKVKQPVLT